MTSHGFHASKYQYRPTTDLADWSKHIENIDFSTADPKTYLQELLQNKTHIMPKYEVIKQEGAVHSPIFTVRVSVSDKSQTGTGKTIKEAEKNAARKLLKEINNKH